ncbi:MAG: hypothetical protein KJZ69_15640 [Phycisphaerales bacterium]|nr:hypothetical protein [Phycisphaerales bacterium]MCL4198920.1 hypothetical protein [Phycisphaerales bacterium]
MSTTTLVWRGGEDGDREARTILDELSGVKSDRNTAIVAFSLVEECMQMALLTTLDEIGQADEAVDAFLFDRSGGPIGSFGVQLKLAFRLSLLDRDTFEDLKTLSKIRNEFGHSAFVRKGQSAGTRLTFEVDPVRSWIDGLRLVRRPHPGTDDLLPTKDARDRFMHVINIAIHQLLHIRKRS